MNSSTVRLMPNSHRGVEGVIMAEVAKATERSFMVSPVVEIVARFAWAFNFGSIEIFIQYVIYKTA
jgi:hypothetical protein